MQVDAEDTYLAKMNRACYFNVRWGKKCNERQSTKIIFNFTFLCQLLYLFPSDYADVCF